MTDKTAKGLTTGQPGFPWWVFAIAGALVVAAGAFYAWVGKHDHGDRVDWWGMMGDSSAPFSALFNAGAPRDGRLSRDLDGKVQKNEIAWATARNVWATATKMAGDAAESKPDERSSGGVRTTRPLTRAGQSGTMRWGSRASIQVSS